MAKRAGEVGRVLITRHDDAVGRQRIIIKQHRAPVYDDFIDLYIIFALQKARKDVLDARISGLLLLNSFAEN